MKIYYFFILIISFGIQLKAQTNDNIVDRIRLNIIQKSVQLEWEFIPGNTCFGITIERFENDEFNMIGYIGGVCGGSEGDYYQFTDSIPLVNIENCYRLILGVQGTTSAECILFTAYNNGFYLQKEQKQLRFLFEKQYKSSIINFYNLEGKLIYSDLLNGNELLLESSKFKSGIYFFTLENIQHSKFRIL
jgi:hypothetical protein